jgi:hypothetical protein
VSVVERIALAMLAPYWMFWATVALIAIAFGVSGSSVVWARRR